MNDADSSSPQQVIDHIVRGIQQGRYVPGQRLIEANLTRELGVSRGPVREAFKRLLGEGILVVNRHRGAYIRAQTREEVRDTMQVLEVLTGLGAKLAAEHIDEGDNRKHFEEAYKRVMAQGVHGETLAFLDERRRFYDVLYRIGGNSELQRMVPRIQISLLRLQFQSYITTKQHERQLRELRAIADAISAGDPKRAERSARTHIRHRRLTMTSMPEEAYAAAVR